QLCRRCREVPQQGGLVVSVVAEIVVGDCNLRGRMGDTLRADGNRGVMVLRLWPLFERVVTYDERAAVGRFAQIARCPLRAIRNRGADHFSTQCAGFDQMTLPSIGKWEFSIRSKSTFSM